MFNGLTGKHLDNHAHSVMVAAMLVVASSGISERLWVNAYGHGMINYSTIPIQRDKMLARYIISTRNAFRIKL
jgi:hypothetical protein